MTNGVGTGEKGGKKLAKKKDGAAGAVGWRRDECDGLKKDKSLYRNLFPNL